MKEPYKEVVLNLLGIHVFVLYLGAMALIARYWIAPLVS